MDDPNITMDEYIRIEEEKAQKHGKVFNWETAKYGKIWYDEKVNMPSFPSPEPTVSYFDDLDYFKDFEKDFPAIVYNDALTSKLDFLTEPIVSPQHIDEFNLKDETSLSKCDKDEQNVLCFNDLFPFNVSYPDELESDTNNDNDKIDMIQSSRNFLSNHYLNIIYGYYVPIHMGQLSFWKQVMIQLINFSKLKLLSRN
ncbi:hypothetical protein Tco_1179907 [Tanacetum coccineum]